MLALPNLVHLRRNFVTHTNPLTSFELNHFRCSDVGSVAGPRPFVDITTVGIMQAIAVRRPTDAREHNLPKSYGFCPVVPTCTLQCCYIDGLLPDVLVLCQVLKDPFFPEDKLLVNGNDSGSEGHSNRSEAMAYIRKTRKKT